MLPHFLPHVTPQLRHLSSHGGFTTSTHEFTTSSTPSQRPRASRRPQFRFQPLAIEPQSTAALTLHSTTIGLRSSSSRRSPRLKQTRQHLQHALDAFPDASRLSNTSSLTLRLHGLRRAAAASASFLNDFHGSETSFNTPSTSPTSKTRPQLDDYVHISTTSFSFFVCSLNLLETTGQRELGLGQ